MTLRQHMEEMHTRIVLPRSNEALAKKHRQEHHHYRCNHYHEGPNTGPNERPAGWTTGEGAVPRER